MPAELVFDDACTDRECRLIPMDWDVHGDQFGVEQGRRNFWQNHPCTAEANPFRADHPNHSAWLRGWQYGWAQAYALGQVAWDVLDDCPYPQFSGPWEAWGDGWNDRAQNAGLLMSCVTREPDPTLEEGES